MKSQLPDLIKRYWFLLGLLMIFAATVADSTETIAGIGQWLKTHHGPDAVIVLIFLFSGILLDTRQIRSGLQELTGTFLALGVIFVIAPVVAALFNLMPLDTGIIIGIFIVAVMPTTLSSGVVMTGAAGGNMAHALFITILANSLAVFTIPLALSLLMQLIGGTTDVAIDKVSIMIKLGCFVLLPLFGGMLIKHFIKGALIRFIPILQWLNQGLILGMVWMGLSQTRQAIVHGGPTIILVILLAFVFHGFLLSAAAAFSRGFKLGRGRRESVIFMGAQKTLPLSIIIQVTLFPEYGQALVFCVVHHIVHLMMDSYLVGKLRR